MIEYKGIEYPVREEFVPGFGFRLISGVSFEDALMPDGEYADIEARQIDELIFFYVNDDEINREDLGKFVESEVF